MQKLVKIIRYRNWWGREGGGRERETYSVTKLRAELLNNETEASGNLMKHGVTERPVRLRRDLFLGVLGRIFKLQQRIKIIRMLQNRPQASHTWFKSQLSISLHYSLQCSSWFQFVFLTLQEWFATSYRCGSPIQLLISLLPCIYNSIYPAVCLSFICSQYSASSFF